MIKRRSHSWARQYCSRPANFAGLEMKAFTANSGLAIPYTSIELGRPLDLPICRSANLPLYRTCCCRLSTFGITEDAAQTAFPHKLFVL